jgi:ATP-dependent DNA ligase
VDGEVAVFDTEPASRFEYLTVSSPPDVVITPPVYIAFDVLLRGRDLRARRLRDRRRALEDLVDGWEIPPVRRLPGHGIEAWQVVQARGYEGS